MTLRVEITASAGRDLVEIWSYVAVNDSPYAADVLLSRLEQAMSSLDRLPARGRVLREVQGAPGHEFRELIVGPHRMVYRQEGQAVYVYAVLDGRRLLRDLLAARLAGREKNGERS
jgi:toxin ParE1/3/4